MNNSYRLIFILASLFIFCMGTVTAVAQRGGGQITADAATLDSCATDVEFVLSRPSTQTNYAYGDQIPVVCYVNSGTREATRIEITISYAGTNLTFDGITTAPYAHPWGDAPWVVTHDVNAKTVNAIVNIGDVDKVAIDDTLLSFDFTYGCVAPSAAEPVYFIDGCPGASEANSIDYDGFHIGAGSLTNAELIAWLSNYCAMMGSFAESGPNATVSMPIDVLTPRVNTGGFAVDMYFDENKLQFVDLDQSGTLTEGKTVNRQVVEVPDGPDYVEISCSEGVGQTLIGVPLFNMIFTNNMTGHGDTTSVNGYNATLTDCYGTFPTANPHLYITTRYHATITVDQVTTSRNSSGSADVWVTSNFPIHMATEVGRARVNFDASAMNGLITVTGISDNALEDFYWEQYTTPGGDMGVKENSELASSTIPASSTPIRLFTINYTTGASCGTAYLNLLGGDAPEGCQLAWAGNENMIFRSISPDFDVELVNGKVTVNGCSPPPPTSCPFVSVWNGAAFVEENTILTQSEYTAEGTPVTDYYALSNRPVLQDGSYRIRIEERENETSYLDQIRLMVAEGEPGRPVSVTPDGKFFYTAQTLRPIEAVDYRGQDVLSQVIEPDGDVYASNEPGWLMVSYQADGDAPGTVVLAQGSVPKQTCKDPNGTDHKIGDGIASDIRFRISYREDGGAWTTLPDAPPRDRSAQEFAATGLQLRAGTRIDVKYEWSTHWATDDLTLNVASDEIPNVVELEPQSVFHSALGKIAGTLGNADNEFAVLQKGEAVELQFPAGRRPSLSTETHFVIAAKGYYTPYAQSNGIELPNSFALHPNYPNPFNAETRIDFAMSTQGTVDIVIFNVLGQTVKNLVHGSFPAGEQSVVWDGTNDQGVPVASGTYFVRMKTGDFEQQRKMTLLK